MAANNYLQVDGARSMGSLALAIHDRISDLLSLTEQLDEALGQAAADDNTDALLQTLLGTTSADNASQIKTLVGSVRASLNDDANAFLQYASRVNRNF